MHCAIGEVNQGLPLSISSINQRPVNLMGNQIGKGRQLVDDKYTRPHCLYHHKDVDHKKLRKLILDSKLAPCYPGDKDCALDLEEFPICFLVFAKNKLATAFQVKVVIENYRCL